MITVIKMSNKKHANGPLWRKPCSCRVTALFPQASAKKMKDHNKLIQEHADTGEGGRTGEALLGVGHGESDHST